MDLIFYLNKLIKLGNIENYSFHSVVEMRKAYNRFLEDTEGSDPDFPMMNLLGSGKRVKGSNVYDIFGDDESAIESIFGKNNTEN